ncbi:hypothetical protein F7725_027163 [Dissostichus mawsoni]|uniref:Ig-like domain-containing protein n=1 Tax=Dissostichus mawsoni TaxID=36200 RepID=A0A7J5XC61_DISMA|nr:hypothetical protein F7725_027163 [Dissostichus mawsoni]
MSHNTDRVVVVAGRPAPRSLSEIQSERLLRDLRPRQDGPRRSPAVPSPLRGGKGEEPQHPAPLLWLQGGSVLQSTRGTERSEYHFNPQEQDRGRSLICRATLDLKDLPTEDQTRED